MFEVRIHGRGGQGAVTAAEMLSVAAFIDGYYAQAFPSFGSERMGAPVVAFCRIDEHEIRNREPVVAPDALVVQDPTLLHQVDLFAGVGTDAYVLVNSPRTLGELGLGRFVERFRADRLVSVPATELALAKLGRPIPNTVLIAGLAALCGAVTIEAVTKAIDRRFSGAVAQGNVAAAREGYQVVRAQLEALAGA